VNVLGNMVASVKEGGLILDLQVIPFTATVETDTRVVCEIENEPLCRRARAAAAAIDALIATGQLTEEAIDDHDVRKHYKHGRELIEDFADHEGRLPSEALPTLQQLTTPCVIRHSCRLRRLRIHGKHYKPRRRSGGRSLI
jgi:hypothetical protein